MPIQILMPALSPTMTEGNLARWLKKEGDLVKAGQVIAEIETDKATMEVEAVDEGKIVKILIPGGSQNIKVNTPIALIVEDGESFDAAAIVSGKEATIATAPKDEKVSQTVSSQPLKTVTEGLPIAGTRVIASPLARRLAEEKKINLASIKGTGPNGRIIKSDVEQARPESLRQAPQTDRQVPALSFDPRDYADKLGMTYEAHPNSTVRKVIAKRLTEAKQTVPHFYLTIDCVIDELLTLRQMINETHGVKVSVNDCLIRAVGLALKKVPAANATWTDAAILLYQSIDVSIAVAGPQGLITPIIKNVDKKSIIDLSREMKDLAARAREGKLKPEEFQGGGFTLSNLGMYGIKEFSAIINPPQSCILAVGAGEKRPIVKDEQISIATVMTVTLSVDHRAVDGAIGAEYLAAFKQLIERPYGLVV